MKFDKGTYLTFGLALVCILLTLVAIGAASADDKELPQPQPVISAISAPNTAHAVISRELQAIKARDANLAYALLSDSFHEKFDTPEAYLAHLRFESRPLYNHDGYTFLDQTRTPDSLIQRVEVKSDRGDPVTVIYRLKQHNNDEFRIDSFAILGHDDEPI